MGDGSPREGRAAPRYTRQDLIEISLVAVPANPSATIDLAVKRGAIDRSVLRDLSRLFGELDDRRPLDEALRACRSLRTYLRNA
jgi:hypothetical protein